MKRYCGITLFEWSILVLVVVVICFYAWVQASAPNLPQYVEKFKDSLNWHPVSHLLEYGNNGDIILLSGNTRGEKTCKWIAGSMFTHVGLLFRDLNENGEMDVWIWDSDLGQGAKKGPRVMKLKDKLIKYGGCGYLVWRELQGAPRPSTEDILAFASLHINDEFDNRMLSWFGSYDKNSLLYKRFKNEKKSFCSELIAQTLQHLNIMSTEKVPAWYLPSKFEGDVYGLIKPYSYGPKRFIKFHP